MTPNTARALVLLLVAAKLLLLGTSELLPQEAYYWNYAQHLAPGYLDHPPFSAWLIAGGTALFGHSEFGVRIGAWLLSLITLLAGAMLTSMTAGKRYAWHGALMVAALPYFFGVSFYLSPDAGLTAMWGLALVLIYRITLHSMAKGSSARCLWGEWLLLGAVFGLGMLSKYTIGLVGVSATIFFLMHRELRGWFVKPQPYLALLICALAFSPVLYWNATHEWASFVFQGARRFSGEWQFSLHEYLGFVLVLTTPVGLASVVAYAADRKDRSVGRNFALWFGLLPIVVFGLYSIRHETKIIWSGPAFLAFIPLFARQLAGEVGTSVLLAKLAKGWPAMLTLSAVGLLGYITYTGVGIPGVGYSTRMAKTIGWQDLGEALLRESDGLEKAYGAAPIVVGMDKHYTAAEVSFYLTAAHLRAGRELPAPVVTGRAVFGLEALMWQYWRPAQGQLAGKTALLVARSKSDLEWPEVIAAFDSLSEVTEYQATRNGKPAGKYYLRAGTGWREAGAE